MSVSEQFMHAARLLKKAQVRFAPGQQQLAVWPPPALASPHASYLVG